MNTPALSNDPVIRAVDDLTRPHKNSNYSKRATMRVGRGNVYAVTFAGDTGEDYEHFVFERAGRYQAYETLDRLVTDPSNGISSPWWTEFETIRLLIVAGLTLLLTSAVIYVVVQPTKNEYLQVLTGLLGLTIGWLVGKAPAH